MKRYKVSETIPTWIKYTSYVEADSEAEARELYHDGVLESQTWELSDNVDFVDAKDFAIEKIDEETDDDFDDEPTGWHEG